MNVSIDPVVSALLADFEFNGGQPRLSDQALFDWLSRLSKERPARPEEVAAQLLAFALKLSREVGEAAETAIGQLLGLTGSILLDHQAAKQMFSGAGIDVEKAAQLTGFAPSKTPVATDGRATDGSSPPATRLPPKKKKPE